MELALMYSFCSVLSRRDTNPAPAIVHLPTSERWKAVLSFGRREGPTNVQISAEQVGTELGILWSRSYSTKVLHQPCRHTKKTKIKLVEMHLLIKDELLNYFCVTSNWEKI